MVSGGGGGTDEVHHCDFVTFTWSSHKQSTVAFSWTPHPLTGGGNFPPCTASRHQYNTSVNKQVVLIMVLTVLRILDNNWSCLFIWYERNSRRTALFIQACQDAPHRYKFWGRNRPRQKRSQRKKCFFPTIIGEAEVFFTTVLFDQQIYESAFWTE